jgi:hypothetical protein
LEETRLNRELEYRAFVVVKGTVFTPNPQNPAYGDLFIVCINTGRTPALNGKILVGGIEPRESAIPEETTINQPDKPPSMNIFAPQIDRVQQIGLIGTGEADKLVQQAATGKPPSTNPTPAPAPTPSLVMPSVENRAGKQIYAYGIVTYDDIFGKHHWTKFCFLNTPGTADWHICPTFNGTDTDKK